MKSLPVFALSLIFVLAACAPAPLPTAVPATSAPVTSAQEFPHGAIDLAGEEQPPGQYTTPTWYIVPFTFETTEAFRGVAEIAGHGQIFGIAHGDRHLPPNQLLFWVLGPDVSAEEALAELQITSQLHFNTEHLVTIGGISGTQFDAAGQGSIPVLGKLIGMPSAWDLNSLQIQIRFTVLPVRGRTLVIYIEAPYDEFESFASKAEQVLGTVEFDR